MCVYVCELESTGLRLPIKINITINTNSLAQTHTHTEQTNAHKYPSIILLNGEKTNHKSISA